MRTISKWVMPHLLLQKAHDADIASSHLYAQEWIPPDKYSGKIGTEKKRKNI